jgi:hypothetical protein
MILAHDNEFNALEIHQCCTSLARADELVMFELRFDRDIIYMVIGDIGEDMHIRSCPWCGKPFSERKIDVEQIKKSEPHSLFFAKYTVVDRLLQSVGETKNNNRFSYDLRYDVGSGVLVLHKIENTEKPKVRCETLIPWKPEDVKHWDDRPNGIGQFSKLIVELRNGHQKACKAHEMYWNEKEMADQYAIVGYVEIIDEDDAL